MFDASAVSTQLRAATAGAAVICLLLAGIALSERNEILAVKDQPTTQINGVLQIVGKQVVVKTGASVLLNCRVTVCGYQDIALDGGKLMTFSLAQGRIVRTTDRQSTRDVATEQASYQATKALVYSLLAALSILTFVYLLHRRHESRKKNSRA